LDVFGLRGLGWREREMEGGVGRGKGRGRGNEDGMLGGWIFCEEVLNADRAGEFKKLLFTDPE